MAKTPSFDQLKKGAAAPGFALPGVDDRTHSLSDFSGKRGLFVLFMCDHCPYVKARMREIVELYEEFGERIAFVGINSSDPKYPGEGLESMKSFVREYAMAFPYLMDEDGAVGKAFGASCTPDPFLFDANRTLVFHGKLVDALEPNDTVHKRTMRENMRKLLADERIEPWFDPSLGCSIKFKQ